MSNLIKLLPDTIANQIAAGEVIQRPASVIKELVENAVDAGATEITVDVTHSGRTAIIVTDNGKGMNEADARMSLERHATSKISSAADLFAINTMGFRGEALASISAIAHMELKTKTPEAAIGTCIKINGGEVISQEPVSFVQGTQIAVKNLFYNVPARRKFLKSDNVEMRHIIDQFERIAIANPLVKFVLNHNNSNVFQLHAGNLRQRLVHVFGKKYNEQLVPVDQETQVVNISGFVLKPEMAKKSRGEQFFFVNNRFIKSGFLHQMVLQAYEELLPKGYHPGYFIFLDVDPGFIDINIHPTKTEIKFEDERTIGMLMRSSVKQAIGMNNVAPTLNFDQEVSFTPPPLPEGKIITEPKISVNQNFNPFESVPPQEKRMQTRGMQEMYDQINTLTLESDVSLSGQQLPIEQSDNDFIQKTPKSFQVKNKFIFTSIKSGVIIINQNRAHQRILFDQYMTQFENGKSSSQQLLFPENINLSTSQSELLKELIPDFSAIGFDIEPFGKNNFIVRGLPSISASEDPKELIEGTLFGYQSHIEKPHAKKNESIAISLAFKSSIKTGQSLSQEEINKLIDELFASSNPKTLPDGKIIYHQMETDTIEHFFN